MLIINADDLGMYPSVNNAVLQSIDNGIASSCSLMPPCPGASQALELLQERAPHSVRGSSHTGLRLRHVPLATFGCCREGPSLLDGNGRLFSPATKAQLLAQARLDEVDLELRSQIEVVLATGLTPTHLDWHVLLTVDARTSSILLWLSLRSIGSPPGSGWNAGGAPRNYRGCQLLITTSWTASRSTLRGRRSATSSCFTNCRRD